MHGWRCRVHQLVEVRSTPVAEPQAQVLVKIRLSVDLANRTVDVIADPAKPDRLFIVDDITAAGVTVTRLSHTTNVDHPSLFVIRHLIARVGIGRSDEAEVLGKDSRYMGVTLKADARNHGKQLFHLFDVLGVFWKDILVGGASGRSVDEQRGSLINHARQAADVLHSPPACIGTIGSHLDLGTRPENRLFGRYIESLRIKQGAAVMIAKDAKIEFHRLVDALAGRRTVANDVSQTDDSVDILAGDILQDCLKSGQVSVDIADDGGSCHN